MTARLAVMIRRFDVSRAVHPWSRIRQAAAILHPAALVEQVRLQARLPRRVDALRTELEAMRQRTEALEGELARVTLREGQLRAVLEADTAADERVTAFRAALDSPALAAHARKAIDAATLHVEPFPYCVVDDLLPKTYYNALIAAIPPVELFGDRPMNKQQLHVPFGLAPRFSRVVWAHMTGIVADTIVGPALFEKFREPLADWLRRCFPAVDDPLAMVDPHCSDGRIMLRRRGYRIPPHRDPKLGFVTCLLYLARPGDSSRWGTQLFSVTHDREARDCGPYWLAPEQCRREVDIDFLPNRALAFLNSAGAHGAHIPADAQPASLERYTYQFRIGPTRRWMDALRSSLPPAQQARWSGRR